MTMLHVLPVTPAQLLHLLEGKGIGVEYQPIVCTATLETHAHEALARFRCPSGTALPPDKTFLALHKSPLSLSQLELQVKRLQLKHAPEQGLLFLNIDQDAFETFLGQPEHPLVELLKQRKNTVVEMIENCSISDARLSIAMQQAFGAADIPVALDDVGALDSLVSFDVLAQVQYIKLARDWLTRMNSPTATALLRALIHFADEAGKTLILEGVETHSQLEQARQLGIPFVQGYLFRERFTQIWS